MRRHANTTNHFFCFLALIVALDGASHAIAQVTGDFWNQKKSTDWTDAEARRLLSQSPWAKPIRLQAVADKSAAPGAAPPQTQSTVYEKYPGIGGPGTGASREPRPYYDQVIPCLEHRESCKASERAGNPQGVSLPADTVLVLWESAPAVRDAMARLGLKESFKARAADWYVISVTGFPFASVERGSAVLRVGKDSTGASDVETVRNGEMATLQFFFRVDLVDEAIQPGKEVVFRLQVGTTLAEARFNPREMAYQGKLVLARSTSGAPSSPPPPTANAGGPPHRAAPTDPNLVDLAAGKPAERELAGGGVHAYPINLTRGQYLFVIVDQRGIDVVVALRGPDGKELVQLDSPNGENGPETLSWIAEQEGNYGLEVRALEKNAAPGKYVARVEALRSPTEKDGIRLAAQGLRVEADQLTVAGTAQSLRNAIAKYGEAARSSRTAGDADQSVLHTRAVLAYCALVRLLWEQKNQPEAARVTEETLKYAESSFDKQHPVAFYPLLQLADSHRQAGRVAEAERIFQWFARTAESAGAEGAITLAGAYSGGIGVPKDDRRAFEWMRKAAEAGSANAQFALGKMLREGQGTEKNVASAIEWLAKAAEQGHAVAANGLGNMYYTGEGVPKDDVEAIRWIRKSAELGYPPAQFNLGGAYNLGQGVRKDPIEAFKWNMKAAEAGLAGAQAVVGAAYGQGNGVKQDYVLAEQWARKAAVQGHAGAQVGLGFLYQAGLGVKQNYEEAAKWYRLAAQQGDEVAKKRLVDLERNIAAQQQAGSTLEKYRASAEEGDAAACETLGRMYERGGDLPRDLVAAYAWYSLAGGAYARGRLQVLQSQMSPEQVNEASRRAAEIRARRSKLP